jgi:DNA-binding NarL/FixJ family response regulator
MSVPANDHHPLIPVAICERRLFDRAALRALCSHDEGLHIVAEAAEGSELLEQLSDQAGLVILIGRSTLRESGGGLVRRIREDLPHARIVVVAISGEYGDASAAGLGADAFLPRDGELADQLAVFYG